MTNQTEAAGRVVDAIKKGLGKALTQQQHLERLLDEVSFLTYEFGASHPSVVVVSMPCELLINAKLAYSAITTSLKKQFPGSIILLRRNTEVVPKKGSNPIRSREEILNDLVFPAAVMGRVTSVKSKEEMTQVVYLDERQSFWTGAEMKTLEKVLGTILKDEYSIALYKAEHEAKYTF